MDAKLNDLPHDRESLEAILRALILERDEHNKRANDLQAESLRLQLELERYQKWRYGPRADRLATSAEVAQALLEFAEQLEAKPIHPEDVPAKTEPEYELRSVKRRPGAPTSDKLRKSSGYDPSVRLVPSDESVPPAGVERKEVGADES